MGGERRRDLDQMAPLGILCPPIFGTDVPSTRDSLQAPGCNLPSKHTAGLAGGEQLFGAVQQWAYRAQSVEYVVVHTSTLPKYREESSLRGQIGENFVRSKEDEPPVDRASAPHRLRGMTEPAHAPHTNPHDDARDAARVITERTGVPAFDIALTLGSGWGKAADVLGETLAVIPAEEVPGFHSSGVPGHSGTLRAIRLENGSHALIIGARTHFYEGRGVRAVVHGVRTAAAVGARVMVLTNGAGGIDPAFSAGEAVLISDHLNLTAASPLEGANFVDLTDLYASRLRGIAREIEPTLQEGIYAQLPGPHYETPAEIGYLRAIGAQIVGMSTTLEAIAARDAGMEVLGLSLITNPAAGMGEDPLSHSEVIEAGRSAEARLADLLRRLVPKL